ncbi:hypothetical protein CYMTET_15624 [Cymbomonas tetramitiformis]|uniref:cGMP-dependent protein kinase n=1 Tax=Cymbomonas tetramitiformis TaxID=36881 RepID=A0AAE0GDM7_9CHLO|nr:hypothetical protein CYMTET_15624 [Cymbomonas tetramitiformis]
MAGEDSDKAMLKAVLEGRSFHKYMENYPAKQPHQRFFKVQGKHISWGKHAESLGTQYRMGGIYWGGSKKVKAAQPNVSFFRTLTVECHNSKSGTSREVTLVAANKDIAEAWFRGLSLAKEGKCIKDLEKKETQARSRQVSSTEPEAADSKDAERLSVELKPSALTPQPASAPSGTKKSLKHTQSIKILTKKADIRKKRRLAVSSEVYKERALQFKVKSKEEQDNYVLPVHQKSSEARQLIRDSISKSFIFSSLDDADMETLLDAFFEVVPEDGDEVIKQGDPGDNFYVVSSGKYHVYIGKGDGEPAKVHTYSQGGSFGELALLYNVPRAATVKAEGDDGVLWAVDRRTFGKVVMGQSTGSDAARFLRECPLFQFLTEKELLDIGGKTTIHTMKEGDTFIKQGDESQSMFVIFEGNVRVLIDIAGEQKQVAVLGRSQFFGQDALLTEEKRNATCMADGLGTVLELQFVDLMPLLPKLKVPFEDFMKLMVLKMEPLLADLTEDQVAEVVDQFEEVLYEPGDVVIEEGEIAQKYYILKKGHCVGSVREGQTETTYRPVKALGVKSLLHDGPFGETVKAKSAVHMWELERQDFNIMLGPLQKIIERSQNLGVIKKVPLLETLSDLEIGELADRLEVCDFQEGMHIIVQGDIGDKFYILTKGTVVVTKSFNPGEEPKSLLTMQPGSFFGERALLTDEPRAANIIATASCQCFAVDRSTFEDLLGGLQDRLKAHYKLLEQRKEDASINKEDLEIKGTLGIGTFGRVFLVHHKYTKRTYALKALNKKNIVDQGQVEHIRNEVLVMQEFNHPMLTKLVRTFKDESKVYMLQEVALGGELFNHLIATPDGYFDQRTAKFMAACVVLGLEHMHNRNIIYRDLKPENLLLDADGYCMIVDYGFAKRVTGKTFTLCGTPDYLAPEILQRKGHNKAVDYWALGVLIFEMLAGYAPFTPDDDANINETYSMIIDNEYTIPRDMDAQAGSLIKKLLHSNPDLRLGSGKLGAKEIKKHPWFADIDWVALERRKLKAPIIPRIDDKFDMSNFDSYPEIDSSEAVPFSHKDLESIF